MLKNSVRFLQNISTQVRLLSSHGTPDLDWDYLLNDESVESNIRNRKGVGDIRRLRQLAMSTETSRHAVMTPEALRIPNATHPDVPVGDESQSRVVAEYNVKPRSDAFAPKSHVEIGDVLKGLRTEGVGVTTGKKSYYLMNDFALLERALIKYTLAALRRDHFRVISVPDILTDDVINGCGFETDGQHNAIFKTRLPVVSAAATEEGETDEDQHHPLQHHHRDFCLSGTAEMGISAFSKDKIWSGAELPLKMAAVSRCFRAEMTTRAIDKGLYRVLQFTKVEMFVLTRDSVESSEAALRELLLFQRRLFEPLGFPFRVVEMSTEELGAPAYHKYDVEAWIRSRNLYSEISSTSNCTDYQSRRLGFRYRDDDDESESSSTRTRYCHSLNGTACAVPRMIQTIVEHNQLENGQVRVPEPLVPFCRNKRTLEMKPDWPVYFYKGLRKDDVD